MQYLYNTFMLEFPYFEHCNFMRIKIAYIKLLKFFKDKNNRKIVMEYLI